MKASPLNTLRLLDTLRLPLRIAARKTTFAHVLAAMILLYMLNAFIQSGYIGPLELVVGAVWIGLCFLLSGWLPIWTILGIGFCLSLAWAFFVESQPISDFLMFDRAARAVADTGNVLAVLDSKSPPTVAYYAVFQAIVDGNPTNRVAGAIAWTAGAYLVYRAAVTVLDNAFLTRFLCAGLAFYPAFLAAAAVPSSEAVYFLLTGTGVWALTKAFASSGNRRLAYAALTGLAVGALYLTRMNGLVLLLPCGFVLMAWARDGPRRDGPRRDGRRRDGQWNSTSALTGLGSLVAGVAVVILAFGCLSAVKGDGFATQPSPHGELNLLFGTNQSTNGGYNEIDQMLSGYASDDPEVRARAPDKARELAWARIRDDPLGFVWFAVTDKVGHLWGREHAVIGRSIGPPERHQYVDYRVLVAALWSVDGAYRITLLLFVTGLVGQVVRPGRAVVLGGIVLLYSLPHLLIEVQPRYHLSMAPYVIAGAFLFIHQLAARFVRLPSRWMA